MPIYEYDCTRCDEVFTVYQSLQGEKQVTCPECGAPKVRKRFSTFSCLSFQNQSTPFSGGGQAA